jgi:hypothetical protein
MIALPTFQKTVTSRECELDGKNVGQWNEPWLGLGSAVIEAGYGDASMVFSRHVVVEASPGWPKSLF